ncbi:RPII140-upstream gene protein [Linepithema humile]|uniref:RPII140-upstream gene protein n=1 Tax=Linepithema humile TaxID=83485 RepID=UPI00062319E2|nr:PREDICTED: RPII140-upstream gene protein [Linepithema humile]XP_012221113.1 PREDICTED: RPII140-upstream gene protein [Linepithema humile]
MRRLVILTRSPMLMSIFPFTNKGNAFDKPANAVKPLVNPLDDEMGWDRVKKIFCLNEEGMFTKELQSIINVTLSGVVLGAFLGGTNATKNTVDNFITNNEATRFLNQFDAKRHLQQAVSVNFIRKGAKFGGKLGLFCCMFSTLTTCTSAYRGKVATENYIFGGAVTGFLYKMNLGFRAALVGTGLGSMLGAVCGSLSILVLTLSGVTMDEVMTAQQEWINSRDKVIFERIKESMNSELPQLKEMYEENLEARNNSRFKQEKDTENCNT